MANPWRSRAARQSIDTHPVTVANEGLGWDSLLKMVHNPGGDCYWVGGEPKVSLGLFHL